MKVTNSRSPLALLLALGLSHGLASAAVISMNVGTNGSITSTDVAGVTGLTAVANWNDMTGAAGNLTASNLVDDLGAATTLDASFTGGQNTFNNNGAPDRNMLSGFLSGGTVSVTLSEIPYAVYDVYVYFNGFTSNNTLGWTASDVSGAPTVISTVYSYRGSDSSIGLWLSGDPDAHVESSYATDLDAAGNAGTYFVFYGLTATDLQIARTLGSGEIGFSGIQVVEAIPEPSSALAGLAIGLLVLRRQRRA